MLDISEYCWFTRLGWGNLEDFNTSATSSESMYYFVNIYTTCKLLVESVYWLFDFGECEMSCILRNASKQRLGRVQSAKVLKCMPCMFKALISIPVTLFPQSSISVWPWTKYYVLKTKYCWT